MKKVAFLFGLTFVMLNSLLAQTTSVKGLIVLVKYSDYQTTATTAQVQSLVNTASGLSLWSNTTSVREFYNVQTNNKLDITAQVITITLTQNSSYYHGSNLGYDGGQLFVKDVVAAINVAYPSGFTGLTMHPTEDRIWFFSILSKAATGPNVAFAFDPLTIKNNGVATNLRHVSIISSTDDTFSVSTMCHEYGHHIMGWTDYYHTYWSNLGDYCVMASAGTSHAPMPVSAPLRLYKGWITNVVTISGTTTQTYTLTANSYSTIHKYVNPNNPKEYLLFHALKHGGYYQAAFDDGKVPDEGLAIWYVDEDGGYDLSGVSTDPRVKLVQADNKDEMHDETDPHHEDVRGDSLDLFDNKSNSFPNGTPFRWKDGGEFGISISNISPVGTTMSFTVNARPNTVLATSDLNGTISPKGVLSAATGGSMTFNLTPNLGYVINTLTVNGTAVTATNNTYTLSSISGTKTIAVTYKKKTTIDPVPSPWVATDIGTTSPAGLGTYGTGSFYLESNGSNIEGSDDNFRFIYQTLSGDGSIVARLVSNNEPFWEGRAGVMIRASLSSSSAYSMVRKQVFAGVTSQQRTTSGGGTEYPSGDPQWNYMVYPWFKVERMGSVFNSYCSKDNFNWVLLSSQTISMSSTTYVGLCVTGANGSLPMKALFDNVSVSTATVNITAPLNNATFSSISSIAINASATDRNGAISKVDFYDGTTLIGTDNTSPYSISWTPGFANGKNTFYAKATDRNGAIITSAPISIYLPCSTDPKRTGTILGTSGAWDNSSYNTKVFDGDVTTYFDAPVAQAWAGYDLGSAYQITGVRFYPRQDQGARMAGGKFQGSNTADFSTTVDLYTILADIKNDWNCVLISNTSTFRYVRYLSPVGGYGNVAEVEFYGIQGNTPPVVSITSPSNNASFVAPASITLTATASDAGGSVSKVDFYNGSTLLYSDVTSPYSYAWTNVGLGTYTITAKATDNTSLATTSTVVAINVTSSSNTAPTVSLTAPANNASFTAPASITLTATASDADGTISKVDFYNGSTLLNSDATSPYSYAWTSVAAGTYSLIAKATDNGGAITTSSVITVTVNPASASGDFCLEAESALGQTTFAPYQVLSDANASGGKYIVVPVGTGTQSAPPTASIASFSFSVPATATYYFWVRVLSPTSNSNSMFIRTDANSFASWTPGTYTTWTWKKWTSSSMAAGAHTIAIARNEDGLQVDKIIVSLSSSTPSGRGCGALARMEAEQNDALENALLVSPNPSAHAFSIVSTGKDITYLSVRNAIGSTVFSSENISKGTRTEFGQEFEGGMYTAIVKYDDGKMESLKLIKVR